MPRQRRPVSKKLAIRMYTRMLTIRRFEEEVKRLYRAGEITGAIHLYIGQEAVAVGACAALREDDYITSGHRSHGHVLARDIDIDRVMAEMMGRKTGLCGGRGGSMHIFDIERGFLGGNGIVGGGIAIAAGAAFSARYRQTDQVSLCFFSDGASNQGVIHECLNMAKLWSLPLVYLCENNRYAATTVVDKSTCTPDIAPRAEAYDLPWSICDGNDVVDVYQQVSKAVKRARSGKGCTFIEAKTYRVEPHCGIIPDDRAREEVEPWHSPAADPLLRFEERLRREFGLDTVAFERLAGAVEERLAEAVRFARHSPYPDPATLGEYLATGKEA